MKLTLTEPTTMRLCGLAIFGGLFWSPLSLAAVTGVTAPTGPVALQGTPYGTLSRASSMEHASLWQGAADQLRLLATPPSGWLPGSEDADALYLEGVALYGMGDPGCVALLDRYAILYPQSSRAPEARLLKGDYYFFAHKYAAALSAYNDVDMSTLDTSRRDLYTYRTMLSMLKCGFDSEAEPLLDRLAVAGGEYTLPAEYYRAYIDYRTGRLDRAYEGFSRVAEAMAAGNGTLESSESITRVETPADPERTSTARRRTGRLKTPVRSQRARYDYVSDGMEPLYYMTQIEYARGQYRDVISHGQTLLDRRRVAELTPELWRIMGLSYFKLGQYAPARGLLEDYVEAPGIDPSPDAVYALGAIEYSDGDYEQAATHFMTLTDLQNDLGQGAYLYLGQCASRSGDENAAAMAFEKAARMNYDSSVGESALYNYIAAQTRGGKIPFSSSISLYEQFLQRYPDSRYAAVVRQNLATAYYNESDYARALSSIERIQTPSAAVLQARQKIEYELGVQRLGAGNSLGAAEVLRDAASRRSSDPALAAQASLWLGDALYNLGRYSEADQAYAAAIKGGVRGENAALAAYDRAYALYMQDKFAAAAPLFREAMSDSALPDTQRADARIRLADCLYYTNDFLGAADMYGRAKEAGGADADYAEWRLALLRGVQGDQSGKIQALRAFRRNNADSRWNPQVLLELARTQLQAGDRVKSIETYEELIKAYPAAPETREASVAVAKLYLDAGQTSKGEQAYRRVLTTWPSSEEADQAHEALKRHYATQGSLESYAAWLATMPGGRKLDADELDTLTFEAAEAAYVENEADTRLLREYLSRYPMGRHTTAVLLDLARSAHATGDDTEALRYIATLLHTDSGAPQAVEALIMKGEIIEARYPERRAEALEAWRTLERVGGAELTPLAWSGIMRTTADERERIDYARRLRGMGGLDAVSAEEARLYEALGMLSTSESGIAEKELAAMAANPATLSGARAAVALGEHYLATKRPGLAVETLSAFTDTGSPHSYWLARGFIALADAYRATGQKYLAVEYLKSLKDNYPGDEPDIRLGIADRLSKWK